MTTIRKIDFAAYEEDLRNQWLEEYFDWLQNRSLVWLEHKANQENGIYAELLKRNWNPLIKRLMESDLTRLRNNETIFLLVAFTNQEVAGAVYLDEKSDKTGIIYRLWVRKQYRNNGIGRRLIQSVITTAEESDIEQLKLATGPFMNTAQYLYREAGFEEAEPYEGTGVPDELKDDWLFMQKCVS